MGQDCIVYFEYFFLSGRVLPSVKFQVQGPVIKTLEQQPWPSPHVARVSSVTH